MKRLMDQLAENGKELSVEQYLLIFLKFVQVRFSLKEINTRNESALSALSLSKVHELVIAGDNSDNRIRLHEKYPIVNNLHEGISN